MSTLKREFTLGTILTVLIGATVLYWLAYLIVPIIWLNDILDGPLIILSFVVAYKYATWAMFNFSALADRQAMIRVGIAGAWFCTSMWRISRFLYAEKVFGPASVGVHDGWRGYMIAMMIVFASMHILAIGMDNGHARTHYVKMILWSIFVGVVLIVLGKLLPH